MQHPKTVRVEADNEQGFVVINAEDFNPDVHKKYEGAEPTVLKDDGPTVAEYVKAGYKASQYPPHGYKSKSSDEEIKAAIAAQESATNLSDDELKAKLKAANVSFPATASRESLLKLVAKLPA